MKTVQSKKSTSSLRRRMYLRHISNLFLGILTLLCLPCAAMPSATEYSKTLIPCSHKFRAKDWKKHEHHLVHKIVPLAEERFKVAISVEHLKTGESALNWFSTTPREAEVLSSFLRVVWQRDWPNPKEPFAPKYNRTKKPHPVYEQDFLPPPGKQAFSLSELCLNLSHATKIKFTASEDLLNYLTRISTKIDISRAKGQSVGALLSMLSACHGVQASIDLDPASDQPSVVLRRIEEKQKRYHFYLPYNSRLLSTLFDAPGLNENEDAALLLRKLAPGCIEATPFQDGFAVVMRSGFEEVLRERLDLSFYGCLSTLPIDYLEDHNDGPFRSSNSEEE
jgi:hypothetical protein